MIRALTFAAALFAFGCGASQPAPQVAHPGQNPVLEARAPYAEAFADAYQAYEVQVHFALTLPYGSEAEAEAVIVSMSSQRFDGLLEEALERRGHSRADLADYLVRDEAFFSELRARYHGRIEHLASEIAGVRDLVVPSEDEIPESDGGDELASN